MGRQRTGMVETLRAVFAAGLLACGADTEAENRRGRTALSLYEAHHQLTPI